VFVVLIMQHAQTMRRTVPLSVACPDLQYLSTLSLRQHDFREIKLFDITFVFWFPVQNLDEAFLVLRINRRDITINAQTASYKVAAILIRFYETLIFTTVIHLSIRFFNSCHRLPQTKPHSSLFFHWSESKFIVVMAACTSSIDVFLGRPLFFSPEVFNR